MEDVAREASVSRALVSLVFRDSPKVAAPTRRRVLDAATRLGYRPNAMARGLASNRANTVGVLIHDLHNPFFAEIVDGLESVADELGLYLLIGHGRGAPRESAVLDTLLEYRPAGVVLLSPDATSSQLAQQLNGTPAVMVGREVRRHGMDVVVNDDALGAAMAVDHLVGLGHRRIVHVSGAKIEAGAERRIDAYRRRMSELGLGEHTHVIRSSFTEEAGLAAVDEVLGLEDRPTAIFAGNDLMAVGIMSGLDDRGTRVPEDMSLVGYDNSALARIRHIDLTTIDQPRQQMGRLALTTLLERIAEGRDSRKVLRTMPTLVVGSSTAPPPDP